MSQEKEENYLKKLDVIWNKISKSQVSGFQKNMLYHLLGRYQEGVEVQTISYLYDNPLATNQKLYEYLVGAIKKLITYAYIGVERESKLTQHYTNRIQTLEAELKRVRGEVEFYKDALNKEKNRKAEEKVVIKKEVEYVHVKESDTEEIEKLKSIIAELEKKNNVEPTVVYKMDEVLQENYETQITDLTLKNKELSDELKSYKQNEKRILSVLHKSVYYQQYQGKCISLEPSQIERVIRKHLDGESSYEISKSMGISKTTVNHIVHCKYRSYQSLKKVLASLHMVNKEGNWSGTKQETLNGLIATYNAAFSSMKEIRRVNAESVKDSIDSIDSFIDWTRNKKADVKSKKMKQK